MAPSNAVQNAPRVAIVYEHLTSQHGGAERVLTALHAAFPNAEWFTAFSDADHPIRRQIPNHRLHQTWMARIPFIPHFQRLVTPLIPSAFEDVVPHEFAIVISVATSAAKAVLTHPSQLHLCYILSPPRYLYDQASTYQQQDALFSTRFLSPLLKLATSYLRAIDQATSLRPDVYIPISNIVAKRVETNYSVTSPQASPDNHSINTSSLPQLLSPVYPPIPSVSGKKQNPKIAQELRKALESLPGYVLSVARLVGYKRIDLSIQASLVTNSILVVVGEGPEKQRLVKIAGTAARLRKPRETPVEFVKRQHISLQKNRSRVGEVWFLGELSDAELAPLYHHASAFILPGIEDFGIAPLEAASFGVRSILHPHSGCSELLQPPLATHIQLPLSITTVAKAMHSHHATATKATTVVAKQLRTIAAARSQENFSREFTKIVYHCHRAYSLKGAHV